MKQKISKRGKVPTGHFSARKESAAEILGDFWRRLVVISSQGWSHYVRKKETRQRARSLLVSHQKKKKKLKKKKEGKRRGFEERDDDENIFAFIYL